MSQETARSVLDSALRLGLIALVGVALLAGTHELTRDRIRDQERRAEMQVLDEIVPPDSYDNDLLADVITIEAPQALGPGTHKVFRGRRGGDPAVLALQVTAPNGYNGPIRMLVGIRYDGRLTGVRVTRHRETPGLGDGIETGVSDWIHQFDGLSLGNPPGKQWAVKRDGGHFEQFTGATITPRAVVSAVRKALVYYEDHRDSLFRPAPKTQG